MPSNIRKGFTLLELSISLGLSLILILTCAKLLTTGVKCYYSQVEFNKYSQSNSKAILTYIDFLEKNKINLDLSSITSLPNITVGSEEITFSDGNLKVNGIVSVTDLDSITITLYNEKLTGYSIANIRSEIKGCVMETQYNLDKKIVGIPNET